jgi:hypothetical protein
MPTPEALKTKIATDVESAAQCAASPEGTRTRETPD